ncbi:hypothetical protein NDU88_001425 [Pleurodeles waltl]|uniref:Uncharacterized protein n=1 Tax=Pleurodeles waltl TaxID=8319 RepID=A0AAV7UA98_PLEWA|nr:hypothetical protein NDU88_001425 [Pleurodeles waltl]
MDGSLPASGEPPPVQGLQPSRSDPVPEASPPLGFFPWASHWRSPPPGVFSPVARAQPAPQRSPSFSLAADPRGRCTPSFVGAMSLTSSQLHIGSRPSSQCAGNRAGSSLAAPGTKGTGLVLCPVIYRILTEFGRLLAPAALELS